MALSNVGSIDSRASLLRHLQTLTDADLRKLCERLALVRAQNADGNNTNADAREQQLGMIISWCIWRGWVCTSVCACLALLRKLCELLALVRAQNANSNMNADASEQQLVYVTKHRLKGIQQLYPSYTR